MLTLQNFESHLNSDILQRGRQYYRKGFVTSLEEVGDNMWVANVERSEMYSVEVTLKRNNRVSDYSCDCPYDGDTCKHVVAVLFALRDEIKKPEIKSGTAKKKNVLENLLKSVSVKEYQDFIRAYAAGNKKFKTEFELFFASKDKRIDVEERYTELIQKLIRKYTKHNYGHVDYGASYGMSKEVNDLLRKGQDHIDKNNFKDAFALAKAVLRPVMQVMEYADDSNGDIGGCIEKTINLLKAIAVSANAADDLKEQICRYLQSELNDKIYFDYGDFGYHVFSVFQVLAEQLNRAEMFLDFVNAQIAKLTDENGSYRREYFQKSKIDFLQKIGKVAEARDLAMQNMDIVEVRLEEVNKVIKMNDLAAAKTLIAGGIKIAESKGHSGTVAQWEEELLRIAMLEKDIATIRHYTKLFAFDRRFSTKHYNQWKATFDATEWQEEIEKHIQKIIQEVTKEWSSGKNKFWKPAYPPLLQKLAPIYIEEKYWDRLLPLVKEAGDLDTALNYHLHLVKTYPDELLSIYLPALEKYGLRSGSRSEYADLVEKMKKIIKDIPNGKDKVLDIAKRLKEKFSSKPRRPAMIQELSKIL